MKTLIILLSLTLMTSVYSQVKLNNIGRDLKNLQLSEVGGGGNGGGEAAMIIARDINARAAELRIPNLKKFRTKYVILVGKYAFCEDNTGNCSPAAQYYPKLHALLIDKDHWVHLSDGSKLEVIDRMIGEISNAH
jgi:hypothetical protein